VNPEIGHYNAARGVGECPSTLAEHTQAPKEKRKMFESTIPLFDRLCTKLSNEHADGYNADLASEARRRLKQLDCLLSKVRDKNSQHDIAFRRVNEAIDRQADYFLSVGRAPDAAHEETKLTDEEFKIISSSTFEMQLFTECFYYIAGRLRTLLQKSGPIPGLESFECKGARDVRNQLLEHVEGKHSQVFIQSFGFGKDNGPVLKAVRYAGQEGTFPDKGLYWNATEIKEILESKLKKLLGDSA
jgi:hypothetical protein